MIDKLFKTQKKMLRVLFGNREKYLDKFKTCVRARPYLEQKLSSDFYKKKNLASLCLIIKKFLMLKISISSTVHWKHLKF